MPVVGPPTAEGDLAQTPFAHLVVYALERKLTGTLLIEESPERIHVLTFLRGSPSKLRPPDDFVRLGRLLTDEGIIDEAILEGALSTRGLLGDVLVMAGHVEPEALERVLERQLRMRFVRCFTIPLTATYRYYEGIDELAEWGAEPTRLDAYELLWAGLERHGDKATSMAPSLTALGDDQPLVIHPRAPLERLGLEGLASDVVELLLLEPTSFTELCTLEVAPIDLTRRVVFALLLLRCFDLGRGTLPVGVSAERAAPAALARVQLKQSAQRLVAAAPDEVGDGERSRARRSRADRRKEADAAGDSGPVSEPISSDPISSGADTPRETPPSSDRRSEGPPSVPSEPGKPSTPRAAPPAEPPSRAAPITTKSPTTPEAAPPPPAAASPAPAPAPAVEAPKRPPPPPPAEARRKPAPVELAPPPRTALKPATAAAAKAKPAPEPVAPAAEVEKPEPDSSVRAIKGVVSSKPVGELLAMARDRLEAKDIEMAIELAEAARERGGALIAALYAAYARSLRPHADLKALSLQIDEVVAAHEAHAEARYYRGLLRKRLGDDAGARHDLEKAHELDPAHVGAVRELEQIEESAPPAGAPAGAGKRGLFGRLFRR